MTKPWFPILFSVTAMCRANRETQSNACRGMSRSAWDAPALSPDHRFANGVSFGFPWWYVIFRARY
ncbi:MAG TPA: hypothetical protein DFJ59_05255 [Alphaproteobacteria bacterium]|nr:hypothetical protein [Alphaproteobacteria bacterium]